MTTRAAAEPIRVLQVVNAMNPGGYETWLMHMLRNIDRKKYQMDFCVRTERESFFDAEIRALGSRVHPCPGHRRPWTYGRNLHRILTDGRYRVVHSHVHTFGGFVLRVAARAGISGRIVHSHNARPRTESRLSWRGVWESTMRSWIARLASDKIACSRKAAAQLFGPDWERDDRVRVFPYSIDFRQFKEPLDPQTYRAELGIPEGSRVLGHVGSFTQPKNHEFLIRLFDRISRDDPRTVLLLVGEGVLRQDIVDQVDSIPGRDRVIFAGFETDVPSVMRGAMDVLVFPSLHEGLGLVIVEAQAAGLGSVCSTAVADEAIVIDDLVRRLSLEAPEETWVAAVKEALAAADSRPGGSLKRFRRGRFDLSAGVSNLEDLYSRAAGQPAGQS